MSLDSVELIVEFEKFFNLSVPDRVAETLGRVGEVADYFSQQLGCNPSPSRTAAHTDLLGQVVQCISAGKEEVVSGAMLLRALWPGPDRHTVRQQLQTCLKLAVLDISEPAPVVEHLTSWWQRLLPSVTLPARPPEWAACTVDDLVDWLLSENYQHLLPAPASLYEVQRAVIGITAVKCGIDIPKIKLTDSFSLDLGVD